MLAPPQELTNKVNVTPPPSKESLQGVPTHVIIVALGRVYREQTANLSMCNDRLASIEEWSDKMILEIKRIEEEQNKKAKQR